MPIRHVKVKVQPARGRDMKVDKGEKEMACPKGCWYCERGRFSKTGLFEGQYRLVYRCSPLDRYVPERFDGCEHFSPYKMYMESENECD